MEIKVFHSFGTELEHLWRSFEKKSIGYAFQTYDWLFPWFITVGKPLYDIQPCIIVISDKDNTQAIFPFGLQERNNIRIIGWLGGRQTDYMCPIFRDNWQTTMNEFSDLWDKIVQVLPEHDVMHFIKQPEKIEDLYNPFILYLPVRRVNSAHQAFLYGSWEEFKKKKLKKKLIADLRRCRRQLSEKGRLRFIIANELSIINDVKKTMIEQKRRRHVDTYTKDELSILENRRFYQKLNGPIGVSGQIHISALLLDDQILATHWGIIFKNRFYYIMPTFIAGKWSRYAPGKLLLENLVEWACDQRYNVFDFTGGSESYKMKWCNAEMLLFEYLKATTLKGHVYKLFQNSNLRIRNNSWLKKIYKSIKRFNRKYIPWLK